MRRVLFAVCLLAHYSNAAPQQRGVQLGAGGPRPVTFAGPQSQNFGPSYSQQLSFGPADAGIRSGAYRPQPIILQQGNPTASPSPSAFASFPAQNSFSSNPGRGPISALRATTTSPADDEYEEYEDEEDAKPQLPVTVRPVQRAPIRVSQPISFSQGPQRLAIPQTQQPQQQVRQRQPVPQRQVVPVSAQPVQQYAPQPQRVQQSSAAPQQQQQSRGQQIASYGLDGKRTRLTTPPPIQTVDRYMKQNEDGSITWGYTNEDGTFKEETIGADCVVRGKYGYTDPDGQKREYEYQSGNPCDPNKKDQEEEEEEEREGPSNQQVQGLINARPRPVQQQQQRRPVPQIVQSQQQPQYRPQQQPQPQYA